MPTEEKFLLYPAEGDLDEDDGMTLLQILKMLAKQLGYKLVKR